MNNTIEVTKTMPSTANSSRSVPRRGFTLITAGLIAACFAFSPIARAVTPAPDGGYPNLNTAEGTDALLSLTTGEKNTAIGFDALRSNTDGRANTAIGANALLANTTGENNTASGLSALYSNGTGSANTADGLNALFFNDTGSDNTADGVDALVGNTTGDNNAANGAFALRNNTAGHDNTSVGFQALNGNTTGNNNIAVGSNAGANLTTGNNNIDIGNVGVAGESNSIRIGTQGVQTRTHVAGIYGSTVPNGVPVIVGADGKLGTMQSSARFKEQIRPMEEASEALLALKPVTFRYKHELDPAGIPQFGLVAEEVEKVNPDLIAYDDQGKP